MISMLYVVAGVRPVSVAEVALGSSDSHARSIVVDGEETKIRLREYLTYYRDAIDQLRVIEVEVTDVEVIVMAAALLPSARAAEATSSEAGRKMRRVTPVGP